MRQTIKPLVVLIISTLTIMYVGDLNAQQVYKSVQIGKQVWMAENLNVSSFRNGDKILQAVNDADWIKALKTHTPAWCYYDYDSANDYYGKLYNCYAVNDSRGLAPVGWHIPSYSRDDYWPKGITWRKLPDGQWEWQKTLSDGRIQAHISRQLPYYLMANLPPKECEWNLLIDLWGPKPAYVSRGASADKIRIAGDNLKSSDPEWGGFLGHKGNNVSGFNALPGGYCYFQSMQYCHMFYKDGDPGKYETRYSVNWSDGEIGKSCAFWTANSGISLGNQNWIVVLSSTYSGISTYSTGQGVQDRSYTGSVYGAYCRCIKDY